MHEVSFEEALAKIQAKDPRYQRDAYLFVREALDHTQKTIAKDPRGRIRHVTGQELLAGIREFALEQFGPMAKTRARRMGRSLLRGLRRDRLQHGRGGLAGENREGQPRRLCRAATTSTRRSASRSCPRASRPSSAEAKPRSAKAKLSSATG